MTKLIVLGSSAIFPLPRTQTNKFEDYLDIKHYQKNFPLHNDPLCNAAKKGRETDAPVRAWLSNTTTN